MSKTHSTYDAKARFSEILRKVRSGQTVRITYHGEEVAEIRPISGDEETLADSLSRLEERGVLDRSKGKMRFEALTQRPGALERFLESRE